MLRNVRNRHRETERERERQRERKKVNVIKTREIQNSEKAVCPLFHDSVLSSNGRMFRENGF